MEDGHTAEGGGEAMLHLNKKHVVLLISGGMGLGYYRSDYSKHIQWIELVLFSPFKDTYGKETAMFFFICFSIHLNSRLLAHEIKVCTVIFH